jgi:hypothetical protein
VTPSEERWPPVSSAGVHSEAAAQQPSMRLCCAAQFQGLAPRGRHQECWMPPSDTVICVAGAVRTTAFKAVALIRLNLDQSASTASTARNTLSVCFKFKSPTNLMKVVQSTGRPCWRAGVSAGTAQRSSVLGTWGACTYR